MISDVLHRTGRPKALAWLQLGLWLCQLGAGGCNQLFLAKCQTAGAVAGMGSLLGRLGSVDGPVALAPVDAGVECIVLNALEALNPGLGWNANQQSMLALVACLNRIGLWHLTALHHPGIGRPLPVACRLVAPVSTVATNSKIQRMFILGWTLP